MITRKNLVYPFLIIVLHQLLTVYIHVFLFPIGYLNQNLFILDLLGKSYTLSFWWIFTLDALNVVVFWLLGRELFSKYSYMPAFVYAISPWGSYSTSACSIYVLYLFVVLAFFYGLIITKKGSKKGMLIFVAAFFIGVYGSFYLFVVFPLFILGLYLADKSLRKMVGKYMLFIFLIPTSLALIVFANWHPFINILSNNVMLFSDPGLVNVVNQYRGESDVAGLHLMGRLSENRYLFSLEFLADKFLLHIMPATIFTSKEKLLGFSFTPPIFLGLIVPFFYGVWVLINTKRQLYLIPLSFLFIIPSLLSKEGISLNRFIIFLPFLVYVLSLGVAKLLENKQRWLRIVLTSTALLLIFQILVAASDVRTREFERYIRYFGQNYEIVDK